MIDFASVTGIEFRGKNATQIEDAAGNVLWAVSGGKVILEVEKITSDTYAAETTYTGEQFILLDIYPKTNGTVSVTYGGLTKTITDTSGAEEPNAQQVFFGTFNGVSDSVTTPASGELTIEGDCVAFAISSYEQMGSKSASSYRCACIRRIYNFGSTSIIPDYAFYSSLANQTNLKIPSTVKTIGQYAFRSNDITSILKNVSIANGVKRISAGAFDYCNSLESVNVPSSVEEIGRQESTYGGVTTISWVNPFGYIDMSSDALALDERNSKYKIDGNCLVEIETNRLICGFNDSIIPSYITEMTGQCFSGRKGLTSVTIPSGVTTIPYYAFHDSGLTRVTVPARVTEIKSMAFYTESLLDVIMLPTTPPTMMIGSSAFHSNATITVPKGCGEAYKAAEGWSTYADYITEAE